MDNSVWTRTSLPGRRVRMVGTLAHYGGDTYPTLRGHSDDFPVSLRSTVPVLEETTDFMKQKKSPPLLRLNLKGLG